MKTTGAEDLKNIEADSFPVPFHSSGMRALCVDGEKIPLAILEKALIESKKISEVFAFDDEDEALQWAKTNPVDVAFLDIELHTMNGLDLAKELRKVHPHLSVVFCIGYEQYAVRAMQMHIDAGYLVKPFRTKQVQDEIDHIAAKKVFDRKLKAKCFGDFAVFINDKPLEFRRKRTRELLAYLIDRRGASVSAAQLCAVFWEDEGIDEKKKDILYHLVSDLAQTLKEHGMEEIFLSNSNGYSVFTDAIDCDYYRMLDGDAQAKSLYTGEYMSQYSWAEVTNAWLEQEVLSV